MGREIRRVPKHWMHPQDSKGAYIPLHDETYDSVAKKWVEEFYLWQSGEHPEQKAMDASKQYPYFWEWEEPPQEEYYRPAYEGPNTCYQFYENTTEGTPLSPVFETKEEMREWFLKQDYRAEVADSLLQEKPIPSFEMRHGETKYFGLEQDRHIHVEKK